MDSRQACSNANKDECYISEQQCYFKALNDPICRMESGQIHLFYQQPSTSSASDGISLCQCPTTSQGWSNFIIIQYGSGIDIWGSNTFTCDPTTEPIIESCVTTNTGVVPITANNLEPFDFVSQPGGDPYNSPPDTQPTVSECYRRAWEQTRCLGTRLTGQIAVGWGRVTASTDPTAYAWQCLCNAYSSATLWTNFESNSAYNIHTCFHAPSPPPPPPPLPPPVPPSAPNVVCEGAGLAAGTWYEPTADSGKIAEYSSPGKTLVECLPWCGSQAAQLCAVRGAVLSKWDIRCGAPVCN